MEKGVYERKLDAARKEIDILEYLGVNGFIPCDMVSDIHERYSKHDRWSGNRVALPYKSHYKFPDDLPTHLEFKVMDEISKINHTNEKGECVTFVEYYSDSLTEDDYFFFYTDSEQVKKDLLSHVRRIKRYVRLANEERRTELEVYRTTYAGAYEYACEVIGNALDNMPHVTQYERLRSVKGARSDRRLYVKETNQSEPYKTIKIYYEAGDWNETYIKLSYSADDPHIQGDLERHFAEAHAAISDFEQAKLVKKLKGEKA